MNALPTATRTTLKFIGGIVGLTAIVASFAGVLWLIPYAIVFVVDNVKFVFAGIFTATIVTAVTRSML